jgi:hypothetical protein
MHTPGPWRIGYKDNSGMAPGALCITADRAPGDNECVVGGGDSFGCPYGVHNEDDAHLIAAAPDLLRELQGLIFAIVGGHGGSLGPDDIAPAKAAIAKAKNV